MRVRFRFDDSVWSEPSASFDDSEGNEFKGSTEMTAEEVIGL